MNTSSNDYENNPFFEAMNRAASVLPIDVASGAWKDLKPGETREKYMGHIVAHIGKMIIVMPPRESWIFGSGTLKVHVFPQPQHTAFVQAAATAWDKGAIGILEFKSRITPGVNLSVARSQCQSGKKLPSDYRRWRRHALRAAFRVAKEQRLKIFIKKELLTKTIGNSEKPTSLHRELQDMCKETGSRAKIRKNSLEITPYKRLKIPKPRSIQTPHNP